MTEMPDPLRAHLDVLAVRRSAAKREAIISGLFAVLAVLAVVVTGVRFAGPGTTTSLILLMIIVVVFITSFMKSWVQLEVTKASEELIEALQRSAEARARYRA